MVVQYFVGQNRVIHFMSVIQIFPQQMEQICFTWNHCWRTSYIMLLYCLIFVISSTACFHNYPIKENNNQNMGSQEELYKFSSIGKYGLVIIFNYSNTGPNFFTDWINVALKLTRSSNSTPKHQKEEQQLIGTSFLKSCSLPTLFLLS